MLALTAPAVVAVLWGTFLSPQCKVDLAKPVRFVLELAVLGAAALALAATGYDALGIALAAVALVSGALNYVWSDGAGEPFVPSAARILRMAVEEGNEKGAPEAGRRAAFRERMLLFQSSFSRFVATGGIIGIGTGVAAIMGSQDVKAWIIGIVVSGISVILAAIVWSTKIA